MPIWQKAATNSEEKVVFDAFNVTHSLADGTESTSPTFYLAILAVAAAVVAVLSMLKYKNRLTQMKLNTLNSLIMAVLLGLMVYGVYDAEELFANPPYGEYQTGFFLPVFAMIFNLLSNRFIRRDERLVRDMDRIR